MMPAGIEQAVGRTWLGMFGMRQEFGQISSYRTLSGKSLSVRRCVWIVCMFSASHFKCLICVCVVLHEHPVKLKDGGSFRFEEGGDKRQRGQGRE